jgi:flagellar basal body rod protein FlgG
MGNRGDVYERYYMPNFIARDTLAIYLSTTPRDDLIKAVGHLERHEDAPVRLTDTQKREIWNNPEVVSLRCRERYAAKIKQQGYTTIKAAEGTKYFTRHTEVQREINSLKTKLGRKLLDKTIDKFHETVYLDKVERQMRGILLSNEVLNPSTIKYELEERATVARLLFQPFNDMSLEKVSQVRVQVIDTIVQLCLKADEIVIDDEDPFADISPVLIMPKAKLSCDAIFASVI